MIISSRNDHPLVQYLTALYCNESLLIAYILGCGMLFEIIFTTPRALSSVRVSNERKIIRC